MHMHRSNIEHNLYICCAQEMENNCNGGPKPTRSNDRLSHPLAAKFSLLPQNISAVHMLAIKTKVTRNGLTANTKVFRCFGLDIIFGKWFEIINCFYRENLFLDLPG